MSRKMVLIDKDGKDIQLLEQIFQNSYEVVMFHNGEKALEYILDSLSEISVIMLDWATPGLDGQNLLQILESKKITNNIPVFMTTDSDNSMIDVTAYSLGAVAVVRKPYKVTVIRKQVFRLADIYSEIWQMSAESVDKEADLKRRLEVASTVNNNLLDVFMIVMEYCKVSTKSHLHRIRSFTRILGSTYLKRYNSAELDETKLNRLVKVSVMYDIGKLAIPETIIHKPTKLTDSERQIMMGHTTKGVEMLDMVNKSIDLGSVYQTVYEISRWHHERYDGKGYPDGIQGNEIPITAQLVGLADVYDALISDRVYKKAYDKETAYNMIMNGECGTFSPEILGCFEESRALLEIYADKE